jgi:hypothetical protein
MALEGKTELPVTLPTEQGDFWIGMHKTDIRRYRKLKEEIGAKIIDAIETRFGNIKAYI